MNLFNELHRLGTAIIFATHNRDILRQNAHPTIRMDAGRVTGVSMATANG
jgi:ABC-type ATPase involved in cell division